MKKIIIGTSIVIGTFVVLVGIIFIVLTAMEPIDEAALTELAEQSSTETNSSVPFDAAGFDSLKSFNRKLMNDLHLTESIIDSLQKQIKFKENLILGYSKTIEKLNDDILSTNNQNIRVKELAKTYESMKTDEMRPILENVDNETVLAIYRNMNSRTRKNILIALPDKRASVITQLLAKKRKSETTTELENISTLSKPSQDKKQTEAKSNSPEDSELTKVNSIAVGGSIVADTKSKSVKDPVFTNSDMNGYRVQLFCSGSSKEHAETFKSDAKQRLNEPLYVDFEANQYKVRAGNFTEMDEAANYCKQAKEQGFKDAWVVKSQIESIELAHP